MRNSPSEKQRVCAFLGSDIRVREACHAAMGRMVVAARSGVSKRALKPRRRRP